MSKQGLWLLGLHEAFQDNRYLNLVTDFMPGGTLADLAYRTDFEYSIDYKGENDDEIMLLPIETISFYLGEALLALEELHSLGFVHRDIKTENIMIAKDGHVKLVDFGCSACVDEDGLYWCQAAIGTPDYVAPEVLQAQNSPAGLHLDCRTDIWGIGVILYELLTGELPFYADFLMHTYHRIMNHNTSLNLNHPRIDQVAQDLLGGILTDVSNRLTIKQIKNHPFFESHSYSRTSRPPFTPSILNDILYTKPDSKGATKKVAFSREFKGIHLPFVGFTWEKAVATKKQIRDHHSKSAFNALLRNPPNDNQTERLVNINNANIDDSSRAHCSFPEIRDQESTIVINETAQTLENSGSFTMEGLSKPFKMQEPFKNGSSQPANPIAQSNTDFRSRSEKIAEISMGVIDFDSTMSSPNLPFRRTVSLGNMFVESNSPVIDLCSPIDSRASDPNLDHDRPVNKKLSDLTKEQVSKIDRLRMQFKCLKEPPSTPISGAIDALTIDESTIGSLNFIEQQRLIQNYEYLMAQYRERDEQACHLEELCLEQNTQLSLLVDENATLKAKVRELSQQTDHDQRHIAVLVKKLEDALIPGMPQGNSGIQSTKSNFPALNLSMKTAGTISTEEFNIHRGNSCKSNTTSDDQTNRASNKMGDFSNQHYLSSVKEIDRNYEPSVSDNIEHYSVNSEGNEHKLNPISSFLSRVISKEAKRPINCSNDHMILASNTEKSNGSKISLDTVPYLNTESSRIINQQTLKQTTLTIPPMEGLLRIPEDPKFGLSTIQGSARDGRCINWRKHHFILSDHTFAAPAARLTITLKGEAFWVQPICHLELTHLSAKQAPECFKIRYLIKLTDSPEIPSDEDLYSKNQRIDKVIREDHKTREERINQIKSAIALEERVKNGASQMLQITTNSVKITSNPSVSAQLSYHVEASNKKIMSLQKQLNLISAEDGSGHRLDPEEENTESIEMSKDYNGHVMATCTDYKPMRTCQVCCGDEWSGSFVECANCELCCHRECHGLVPVTCSESHALQNVKPIYFMASSRDECIEWVKTIDASRRSWLLSANAR